VRPPVTLGAFLFTLASRSSADVTVLRGLGAPYIIEADGRVANQVRVKVTNRSTADRQYQISIVGLEPAWSVIAPRNPLPVASGGTEVADLFLVLPTSAFLGGERAVLVRVDDGSSRQSTFAYRLVGPEHHEDSHEREKR
jgi:IG-like fold at C-terminal of FixG, putative oxidoreductase